MSWINISAADAKNWNEKLKATTAAFYQYPYYISSEYNSAFAKACLIKYIIDGEEIAYAGIIEIGTYPFKVGIIDGGPILLQEYSNHAEIIDGLKKFVRKKSYMHLQIRPAFGSSFYTIINNDAIFEQKVYFPFHEKISFDANIYSKEETDLLAGFKLQGRRKIVLAGRVPYNFYKVEDEKTLDDIRNLFKEVTETKGYGFLPFKTYEAIYREGKKYNLCDFYVAYLNDDLVNFVLVTKDGISYYHYTSALRVKGYKPNESPPAKLHLFIMRDCFYNDEKEYYNISFGGSDNLLRFKEYFNPVEVERPPYYTYVVKKNLLNFMSKFTLERMGRIRKLIKGR